MEHSKRRAPLTPSTRVACHSRLDLRLELVRRGLDRHSGAVEAEGKQRVLPLEALVLHGELALVGSVGPSPDWRTSRGGGERARVRGRGGLSGQIAIEQESMTCIAHLMG